MAENKPFSKYVAETKSEYKYILKFALNEMTDPMIDILESCLKKYDLKSASEFRKTPIQESPLDFPNVKNTPVYTCDLTLGYPGSLDFLRTHICNSMGISPQNLVVYSENDPRQIETDLYLDRNSDEFKRNYKTRLGTDYTESDVEHVEYGEKYNTSFLQELEKVSKERKVTTVINPLSPESTVESPGKDYDTFNDSKNLKKDDVGLFGRVKKPNLIKTGVL